ncbi:response regulator transcription factor [Alkalihalobacillus sp. AL-G]|uniref:response regulator transcription factor n=1 Tax=Alkalihalobacillus sp. AL-G TaxID=2926399 RepID=UPI00272BEE23|nr:response regulator transcription factor [Alkalihalobacillus sp. AL-G]WLD93103.1 response regulator transcription factor [Alkalihalobacillus sp. AL-G]
MYDILVVGKKKMLNDLLKAHLENDNRMKVIESTTSIDKAQNMIYALQPNLVLMINFEGNSKELNLISYIKNGWNDQIKTAVLNSNTNSLTVKQALSNGVASYITYDYSSDELIESLIQVLKGKLIYPHIMNLQNSIEFLTPKEKEILAFIANGNTNLEISKQLLISKRTVEYHISTILHKLDAKTRVQAVVTALKSGILY